MGLTDLLGLNMKDPKATFLLMAEKIKPYMKTRNIKSIIIFLDKDDNIDLAMLEHSIKDREAQYIAEISRLNKIILNAKTLNK